MKLPALILFCLALPIPAQEWTDRELPRHIRIIAEYIEVPHTTFTAVMLSKDADSGPKLHARMRALVREKKARILETSIVVARPGQKGTVESIGEFIAPIEWDNWNCLPRPDPDLELTQGIEELMRKHRRMRPETPTAFEIRNVGVTLEIEPNLGSDNKVVDLRIAPELVDRLRLETWVTHVDRWGDASIRRPTYESLRMSTGVTLLANTWGFVGIHTPHHPDGGRDTTRKIMLFVRADVIPIPHPDTLKP